MKEYVKRSAQERYSLERVASQWKKTNGTLHSREGMALVKIDCFGVSAVRERKKIVREREREGGWRTDPVKLLISAVLFRGLKSHILPRLAVICLEPSVDL